MIWALYQHPSFSVDLPHYAARIAADNPDAAFRFIDAVEATLDDLAEQPYLSTSLESSRRGLAKLRRRLVNDFANYALFVSLDEARREIYVWGLFHGARDLPRRLRERLSERG